MKIGVGNIRAILAALGVVFSTLVIAASEDGRAVSAHNPPVNDGLPMPTFEVTKGNTAIVITDPQNDFLSPDGVTWGW